MSGKKGDLIANKPPSLSSLVHGYKKGKFSAENKCVDDVKEKNSKAHLISLNNIKFIPWLNSIVYFKKLEI